MVHVAKLLRCHFCTSGLTKVTKKIQEKRIWQNLGAIALYLTSIQRLSASIRLYRTLSSALRLYPRLPDSMYSLQDSKITIVVGDWTVALMMIPGDL